MPRSYRPPRRCRWVTPADAPGVLPGTPKTLVSTTTWRCLHRSGSRLHWIAAAPDRSRNARLVDLPPAPRARNRLRRLTSCVDGAANRDIPGFVGTMLPLRSPAPAIRSPQCTAGQGTRKRRFPRLRPCRLEISEISTDLMCRRFDRAAFESAAAYYGAFHDHFPQSGPLPRARFQA